MSWDAETTALLIDWWENTPWTAKIIGKKLGVSRNAVIGKVHRIALKRRRPSVPVLRVDNKKLPNFVVISRKPDVYQGRVYG